MELDPLFIGPAALAKAYRFVGDPRDAEHRQRLLDLSEDPHGIYDCTHCFNCIDACPKGVAPMNQIMRLRRVAGNDQHIVDRNNGHRHEDSFVTLVRDYGLLHEAELLPRSYGGNSWFGKFHPAAGQELVSSLGSIAKAVVRGKVSIRKAVFGHKIPSSALSSIKRLYKMIEGREQRVEFNIYVEGREDDLLDEPVKTPGKPKIESADESATPADTGGTEASAPEPPRKATDDQAAEATEEPVAQASEAPKDKSPTFPSGDEEPKDKSPTFPSSADEPKDKSPTFPSSAEPDTESEKE
jgi:succinate dehydrogenase / fumarate reductase iron-sulfur subunit